MRSWPTARGVLAIGDRDGVAICQFPTLRDLEERFDGGPESDRASAEDVVRFGDPARLDRVRMSEYVLR